MVFILIFSLQHADRVLTHGHYDIRTIVTLFSSHTFVYTDGCRTHLKHKFMAHLMVFIDTTAIDNVHRKW
jgi:hypothetical protein